MEKILTIIIINIYYKNVLYIKKILKNLPFFASIIIIHTHNNNNAVLHIIQRILEDSSLPIGICVTIYVFSTVIIFYFNKFRCYFFNVISYLKLVIYFILNVIFYIMLYRLNVKRCELY